MVSPHISILVRSFDHHPKRLPACLWQGRSLYADVGFVPSFSTLPALTELGAESSLFSSDVMLEVGKSFEQIMGSGSDGVEEAAQGIQELGRKEAML
jgi:hypothetical protein